MIPEVVVHLQKSMLLAANNNNNLLNGQGLVTFEQDNKQQQALPP